MDINMGGCGNGRETKTRWAVAGRRAQRQMNKDEISADSETKRIGGQARPEQEVWPEDGGAWGGWRRNVRKCMLSNQGYLSWCWKEQGRSQSPHSSDEASNDRGAKGDRKVET